MAQISPAWHKKLKNLKGKKGFHTGITRQADRHLQPSKPSRVLSTLSVLLLLLFAFRLSSWPATEYVCGRPLRTCALLLSAWL
jgi:hypothetical protein